MNKEIQKQKEQINKQDIKNIGESLRKVTHGERVKCVYCGQSIHIDNFAGVTKKGFICGNSICLMELVKEFEETK